MTGCDRGSDVLKAAREHDSVRKLGSTEAFETGLEGPVAHNGENCVWMAELDFVERLNQPTYPFDLEWPDKRADEDDRRPTTSILEDPNINRVDIPKESCFWGGICYDLRTTTNGLNPSLEILRNISHGCTQKQEQLQTHTSKPFVTDRLCVEGKHQFGRGA